MKADASDRRNVLIVDDDRTVRNLLIDILEPAGYLVVAAIDGRWALEALNSFAPDIVISDVTMPKMDGIELCRRLKRDVRTVDVPVLLISGTRKTAEDSLEGLIAGAADYLELPFRQEELLAKVARLTERHRIEKHYKQIVEQAADIIYTRDMQGFVTSINEAGARFFGRRAAEIVGSHLSELVDAELATRDTQQTLNWSSDEPLRSTNRIQNAQGVWRHLESVANVERDTLGHSIKVRAVVRDVTEQKVIEEALKESEERYRRLVEFSPEGIVVHHHGKFVYVNPAAQRLWGASCPEDLLGTPIMDVIHDDYRAIVSKRIQQIETEGVLVPAAELKLVRLDGQVIDVESRAMPFVFKGETAVQVVITDITERKRSEEALRQSEDVYRELFENANDVVYTHDLDGTFISLNRAGERITGYSREEARQMKISAVLAPEYLDLARQMMVQKSMEQKATVYQLEIIAKAGHRVRLEVSTRLVFKDQQPVAIQGIARDVTDRQRTEEALQETQTFFHSFMNNSPAVAFMKDAEGRYVYVNEPFERVFGKKLTFLRGKTSFDWLPPETAKLTHENDLQILAEGNAQEIVETVPAVDGSLRHWLVFKFPMKDVSGRHFVAGVGVDITDRRRAQEELAKQADREALTHLISQAVRRSLDSTEVFQTAVRELGSQLNVDRCSLYMRDERKKRAVNVAEYHAPTVAPAGKDFDLPSWQPLIQALDQNGVMSFDDAAHDERISELYDRLLSKANVQSIMYVAIRVGDEVPAAFVLSTTRTARQWSEADAILARAVADQTGIAIRQAQLYQKAAATSVRESLANRLSLAIRASLSLPEVLKTATHELGRVLEASRVHLHLYDPEKSVSAAEFEYVGQGCSSIRSIELSYDEAIGQRLRNDPNPLVIDDALEYQAGAPELAAQVRAQAKELELRSQICHPLIVKGVFRGALCINQTDRVRYWTEDEMSLVESVAAQLATGIAQAELFEMVARAKQEWETTFDAMSDGIFIFDREGCLKRVNKGGAAMESTSPQELLGRKCCDILRTSAEDQACVVERAILDLNSSTIEITPVRLQRPLLVTIEPVLDHGNKLVAVVCTARDLSELRKAEAVAREQQSLLTNILESARESIYAVDNEGRFKWCNNATLRGLGQKREDFIGRHLLDRIHESDRELVAHKLDEALRGQPQTYEMRYFGRDGALRYARVDNSPLIVDGKTTGVLGIARDVTGQKEERERAARADKLRALGQLASGVAHDFNNSLAAILGRAQLLRRQTNEFALLRNIEIIQTAAQDAAATVRRIQTFARKSSAKEFELLDMGGLLNDAIEITRTRWHNEARLRGLEYQVGLEAEEGLLTNGSASELREVFVNLIVNAIDAMPNGGRLLIACARDGQSLKLRFADTGGGMPEDVREKVFEPFFSTKGAHGTGLGLSVSYSIIERHGGSIRVETEVGFGTTFLIDLPASQAQSTPVAPAASVPDSPSLSILVIDDEPSVRETLADMLGSMNHHVTLADGGRAALQQLPGNNFDLVFTDLAMPEMDGWETARELRKMCPDLAIVLVTGYGTGTMPPQGENSLIDGILGKPFDFEQVSEMITRVCAHPHINEPELVNA
jgi:PAS domain S-box-containing protein